VNLEGAQTEGATFDKSADKPVFKMRTEE
jgi:hypothetical protein